MTSAYDVLSDNDKRVAYVKELELGNAEKILQAEALLEEGKDLLTKSSQPRKAKEKFEKAISLRPPTSELLIYSAWAELASVDASTAAHDGLGRIEAILNKIPPED
jgi:hypothetical protein